MPFFKWHFFWLVSAGNEFYCKGEQNEKDSFINQFINDDVNYNFL
jgi:hypothetical protein